MAAERSSVEVECPCTRLVLCLVGCLLESSRYGPALFLCKVPETPITSLEPVWVPVELLIRETAVDMEAHTDYTQTPLNSSLCCGSNGCSIVISDHSFLSLSLSLSLLHGRLY